MTIRQTPLRLGIKVFSFCLCCAQGVQCQLHFPISHLLKSLCVLVCVSVCVRACVFVNGVLVLSPHSFAIGDTSQLHPFAHGGFFVLVKTPKTYKFVSPVIFIDRFDKNNKSLTI